MSGPQPKISPLDMVDKAIQCTASICMLQQVAARLRRPFGAEDATLLVERFGRDLVERALLVATREYSLQDEAGQAFGAAMRAGPRGPLQ